MLNIEGDMLESELGPTSSSRLFVENKWGITVRHQLEIERYFDSLNELCSIRNPLVQEYCGNRWSHFSWDHFVEKHLVGESWS
jgi:hypothetical protein